MKADRSTLGMWLDEVAAHLAGAKNRADILLELESAVLDRAEESGNGAMDPEAVARALAAFPPPAQVALAYTGERYLVGPAHYRSFLVYTGILFAVHLVLIVAATVLDSAIEIFPLSALEVRQPASLPGLLLSALQALLMDIGVMVLLFAGIGRTARSLVLPRVAFRVPTSSRPVITRILLALLVLVILNLLRDHFFVVILEDRVETMFSAAFSKSLPLLNLYLALVIAKEAAYGIAGERKWVVAFDGALFAAGAALMVFLLAQPPLLSFPQGAEESLEALPSLNHLMDKVLELILLVFSAAFAVGAVKRAVRIRQLVR